jgi:hypothetical protein
VQYGEGYSGRDDLPIVDGHRQFAAGIPDDWDDEAVKEFIFWPMNPDASHPAWEVPARSYGRDTLFVWEGR